jgi:hypothetical protein
MNKRIKELAEQAGYEKDMFGIGHWDMPECQKFAELMSAEFIGLLEYEIAMLEKYKTAACNDFDRRWHEGKIVHFNKLIEKTKDHFGVEE